MPSDTIPEKFVQCLYPGACLGARNEAEKGRFLHPITEVDLALTANEVVVFNITVVSKVIAKISSKNTDVTF